RQDAAVFVRNEFLGRVDAHDDVEFDGPAIAVARMDRDGRARLQAFGDAVNRVDLAAGEPDGRGCLTALELQRQDAPVDEVAPGNAAEARGDAGVRAEQQRAFRRPVG